LWDTVEVECSIRVRTLIMGFTGANDDDAADTLERGREDFDVHPLSADRHAQ
jgi:hypothetical protein